MENNFFSRYCFHSLFVTVCICICLAYNLVFSLFYMFPPPPILCMIHCIITGHQPVVALSLVNLFLGHCLSGCQSLCLVSCYKPGSWTCCILSPLYIVLTPHTKKYASSGTVSPERPGYPPGVSSVLCQPPPHPQCIICLSFIKLHPFISLTLQFCSSSLILAYCPFLMSLFSAVGPGVPFQSSSLIILSYSQGQWFFRSPVPLTTLLVTNRQMFHSDSSWISSFPPPPSTVHRRNSSIEFCHMNPFQYPSPSLVTKTYQYFFWLCCGCPI